MYIRQCFRTVAGQRRAYWALVESVRTERGPRQNVVAWLGSLDEAGRLGLQQAAQTVLSSDTHEHNTSSHSQLALKLIQELKLDAFLNQHLPQEENAFAGP